jgi:putative membrane protein
MAAKTDMTEAHEGQLSANQATRDDVKSFAQALVRDHTEAYTELSQLAQKDGVPIPTGIDSGKNREIVQLQHLKGARFDHEFISYEIADHQHALAAFKKEAAHGQDPDVKAYAAKMVPILENHLHQAEECARTGKRT